MKFHTQTELISHYTAEITRVSDITVDLNKKVQTLEKENKDLKTTKSGKPAFPWWLLVIGFVGGVVAYYYLGGVIGKLVGWVLRLIK